MNRKLCVIVLLGSMLAIAQAQQTYLGFDRNLYPGNSNLKALRQTFTFSGYWLNNPPGEKTNSWRGKRNTLLDAGFGFLVLFNGRDYAAIRKTNPRQLGLKDANSAIAAAQREGFPRGTIIFLDQEQGGRMLPEQRAYLHAWIDTVNASGYRAGIYCSGIPFKEDSGESVVTASDIRDNSGKRQIAFFVSNDQCGPSPGCLFPKRPPNPHESGVDFAEVWQFAQSPRRPQVTAACRQTYSPDGECYAPGIPASLQLHVDVDSADSPDPSYGRGSQK